MTSSTAGHEDRPIHEIKTKADAALKLRATVRSAGITLVLGWCYAAVYGLRRESLHSTLPDREAFGRQQYSASDAHLVGLALDWSMMAWIVLPLLLLISVVLVATVGVGHIAVFTLGMACTPTLPLAGAVLPLDPALAVIAIAFGVSVVWVMALFLRALSSS